MAQVNLTYSVETEVCLDAVAELEMAMRRIVKRHGAQYRELERRIEALCENDGKTNFAIHALPDGVMLVAPTGPFTDVLREARRLDLI